MPAQQSAVRKALELDDTLAEAHTTLADRLYYCDWDWANAEREFQRAIALNPNYPTGPHWYSEYLSNLGRHDQALALARRALELDPFSLAINWNLGGALYLARRYDEAIEQLHKTVEMDSNPPLTYTFLALAYEQKGMYAEAFAAWQKGHTLSGETELAAAMGEAYRVAGYRGAMQKRLREMNKRAERQGVRLLGLVHDSAFLGDKEQAFAWLEKAYQEREDFLVWLKTDPSFDPLRSDPRFQNLLRRMNFPP